MQRRNFTLVELLVSLGVFSILLIVFMQFFSGMRLAWTNTEKRAETHYSVRIVMDLLASMVSSMYYTNAPTDKFGQTVQFPFRLVRSGANSSKPAALYFATKGGVDLPGTCPVKFIGVQFVTDDAKFGLDLESDAKRFNAIYLTVISNAEKNASNDNINEKNRDIYHCFWPAPVFLKGDETVDAAAALDYLKETLDAKLKSNEYVQILDRVTEFKVRLFDEKDAEIGSASDKTSTIPHSVELTISVMNEADFTAWKNGGKNDDFRVKKQLSFTRRIYIGQRWEMEEKYDKYD